MHRIQIVSKQGDYSNILNIESSVSQKKSKGNFAFWYKCFEIVACTNLQWKVYPMSAKNAYDISLSANFTPTMICQEN